MADKDFEKPDDGDEVLGAEGSEANASDPAPQGDQAETDAADELTIEDILGAAQSDEAAVADAPEEEHDLLLDLKRVQAEYANYRRRTEDQREVELARAKGSVAKGLLPVLDDLDRAEKHGDLTEGSALSAIAEKLRGVVTRLGVERYAAAGDAFDPQQHEAIFQAPTPGVTEPTILEVVETGYRLGDIELRPAKVVVAVPAE
ncbi:nucleotide exchange factor GrpE [Microbacterium dauci]|uniref:Protein GrpE n=1 Tax=Microbacterium dauci TaxID=3048008 RepID=A0ABT6ZDG6_9MICO|nr:nucleotide exchange factor GrpE [Microbacterium sp. LX3-4]MDJ1114206.1 nucleotide exchange factor GrpE [Microbacterium sp. LX3-4]